MARIRQGYQEGYRTSLFDAAGSILGLLLVLLAIKNRLPLVCLVLAMAGSPVIASLVHATVMFGRDRPWLRVDPERFDRRTATRLLQHGGLFFALQLAASFVYAPDNVIIAQTLGPTSVAHYSVAAKLFTVSVLLSDVALAPLWPAYGEAMARGDHEWVHRTLARSIQLAAFASILFSSLLIVGANEILTRWVVPGFSASPALRLGLGALTIVMTMGMAVAMYLNAANLIRVQVILRVGVGAGESRAQGHDGCALGAAGRTVGDGVVLPRVRGGAPCHVRPPRPARARQAGGCRLTQFDCRIHDRVPTPAPQPYARPLRVVIDARRPGEGIAGGVEQVVIGLAYGLSTLTESPDEYLFLTAPPDGEWIAPYLSGGCRVLPSASPSRAQCGGAGSPGYLCYGRLEASARVTWRVDHPCSAQRWHHRAGRR